LIDLFISGERKIFIYKGNEYPLEKHYELRARRLENTNRNKDDAFVQNLFKDMIGNLGDDFEPK
jgi:hypothetical protein